MAEEIIDGEVVNETTEEMVYTKDFAIGNNVYAVDTVQIDGKEYVLGDAIKPMIDKELTIMKEQFERVKSGLNTISDDNKRYKKIIDKLLGE